MAAILTELLLWFEGGRVSFVIGEASNVLLIQRVDEMSEAGDDVQKSKRKKGECPLQVFHARVEKRQ